MESLILDVAPSVPQKGVAGQIKKSVGHLQFVGRNVLGAQRRRSTARQPAISGGCVNRCRDIPHRRLHLCSAGVAAVVRACSKALCQYGT